MIPWACGLNEADRNLVGFSFQAFHILDGKTQSSCRLFLLRALWANLRSRRWDEALCECLAAPLSGPSFKLRGLIMAFEGSEKSILYDVLCDDW